MFKEWKPELNLLAETSGKNSIVITASADIDSAVKDLVASAFGHAGQKCSAASLAIVDASIYESESFRSQLVDAARSLAFGPSTNIETTNGPLIRPPSGSLHRALTQLEPGESWLLEPRQLDQAGYLWTAGIKLGIAPNSWSHVNEWFGPVLGLMKAQNLNEALRWQNATPYGLTAGIASLDEEECNQWAAQVEAGNTYINRGVTGAVVSRQPFGGWKQSSVGPTAKAGGPHYLEQLCEWSPVGDTARFIKVADHWLKTVGVTAVQTSGLTAELNYFRYRPYEDGILVVVDKHTNEHMIEVLQWMQGLRELNIRMLVLNEDEDLLTQIGTHARGMGKVRWLSNEACPEVALMKFGVSIDKRHIADEATVELPRWLREQSISVTNHRYGNVGAAPHVAIV
jgi:RHH-type proline utilization regulon transcriptional repressor/proline dehydrogenase/delta 1-pyrroline-5-carboxylate dehydrogenase